MCVCVCLVCVREKRKGRIVNKLQLDWESNACLYVYVCVYVCMYVCM
jgi:hypothetical protein